MFIFTKAFLIYIFIESFLKICFCLLKDFLIIRYYSKIFEISTEVLISYAYGYEQPDLRYDYPHIQARHLVVRLEQYVSCE